VDGNIKFKLDLFNKYNKEKKADTALSYKATGMRDSIP
jgi:hypothetical protein